MRQYKYSIWIAIVIAILLLTGGITLYRGNLKGSIPFIIGAMMLATGLKGPKSTSESPTRKVWLITFLGRQTETIVTSLTLVLDWPFDIVGYIEIDMKQVDHDFPLRKPVVCSDNAYVSGHVSTSMMPDEKPDPIGTPNGKSGGKKLQDFLNMGGIEGAKTQLDDTLTGWVQKFANHNDSLTMESLSLEISEKILEQVKVGRNPDVDNNHIADSKGLGLRFKKFNVILQPTQEVMDARNDSLVEDAQRVADLKDRETMDTSIKKRLKVFEETTKGKDEKLTFVEARDQLYEEGLAKKDRVQTIRNQGGINIAEVGSRRGDKK